MTDVDVQLELRESWKTAQPDDDLVVRPLEHPQRKGPVPHAESQLGRANRAFEVGEAICVEWLVERRRPHPASAGARQSALISDDRLQASIRSVQLVRDPHGWQVVPV